MIGRGWRSDRNVKMAMNLPGKRNGSYPFFASYLASIVYLWFYKYMPLRGHLQGSLCYWKLRFTRNYCCKPDVFP